MSMVVFLDDMVVKANSCEEHANNFKQAFNWIWKHNLKTNPLKYAFESAIGNILGFLLQ